ncbi:YitT family protein [Desulfosporosinus fructosivorans]|uniref:YitT family protein n=1 Tax=Desulfosporosinus fructosivorans TaxID=2018669 RepID=A0A4Z0R269_9FIRM|nr:YitT family protein [Desulfosporosinus fructosivorans]TGE36243.1 YitT family protein [Desulfosporosinus fructosivorans]
MKEPIKEYLIITLGVILVSIAVAYFYVPAHITGGGITGIAIIINYHMPSLPIGMLMLVMNVVLFIIGFLFIGGNFGAKTIYASFGVSGTMWLIEVVMKPQALTNDVLLSAIIGTLLLGTGLGIVFSQNASTGGTDIIAKILNKSLHLELGKSMQSVDIFVVLLAALTFGIATALYSVVCVLLNGFIIDRVLEGFTSVKAVMVFSNNSEYIQKYIINEIDRGCTAFEGQGGFSGEKNSVIYSVMDRTQLIKLRTYLKKNYPDSFIIVSEAHEVLGKGFQNIENV